MIDLLEVIPDHLMKVEIPSPFPATVKTPVSRKSYNVEWHALCEALIEAPQIPLFQVGETKVDGRVVPYVEFDNNLYRRVFSPEGFTTLKEFLEVAPFRLLGGEGIHSHPWWTDHPLAMQLDKATAELFPGMVRPPGEDDWWREGKVSPEDLKRELQAKERGRAIAQQLLVVGGNDPYKRVHIPGWVIQIDGTAHKRQRWLTDLPISASQIYLPYHAFPSRMEKQWQSVAGPRMSILASFHACQVTLDSIAATIDRVDDGYGDPIVERLRYALAETRRELTAVVAGRARTSMFKLLPVMSDSGIEVVRNHALAIERYLPAIELESPRKYEPWAP